MIWGQQMCARCDMWQLLSIHARALIVVKKHYWGAWGLRGRGWQSGGTPVRSLTAHRAVLAARVLSCRSVMVFHGKALKLHGSRGFVYIHCRLIFWPFFVYIHSSERTALKDACLLDSYRSKSGHQEAGISGKYRKIQDTSVTFVEATDLPSNTGKAG
ncbi:hypothetical protein [Propionivibrio sp.]|uniref:hypothetical protein n=1 Tax=Propionivibrio sp. TaxID=2212460 RepID=UPI003BF2054F